MRYSKEEMFGIQFDSPNMNLILNFFHLVLLALEKLISSIKETMLNLHG